MTSGNMVNAGVSAEGYAVADGMTAVSWDPQKFDTEGANSNDIVNLNVNVNVSGATVDRGDYGGGDALAGWAISVMMGDAAVAGAPTMLDDDGNAAFTTTVASVPASFTFLGHRRPGRRAGRRRDVRGLRRRLHTHRAEAGGRHGRRPDRGNLHDADVEGLRASRARPGPRLHGQRPGRRQEDVGAGRSRGPERERERWQVHQSDLER